MKLKDKESDDIKKELTSSGYAQDSIGAAQFAADLNDNKFTIADPDGAPPVNTPPVQQPNTVVVNNSENSNSKIQTGNDAMAKELLAMNEKLKEMEKKEKDKAAKKDASSTNNNSGGS